MPTGTLLRWWGRWRYLQAAVTAKDLWLVVGSQALPLESASVALQRLEQLR